MAVMAKEEIPAPEKLKALRKSLKLTQAQAADKIGVSQGVWAAWENGLRRPSQQSIKLIRLILGDWKKA